MDRDEAIKLLKGGKEGVREWNRRRGNGEKIPGLRQADLSSAIFHGANLSRAYLIEAKLIGADLIGADLNGADLSGARLSEAHLRGTNLSGADLSEARCWGTALVNMNLSEVKGLERVNHDGPSSIGLDTIHRSKGKIPQSFLRGCGVPEQWIEELPSWTGMLQPIQFHSCFISYSSKNQDFAERLHAALQAKGVRCWYDSEDLKIGDKIRPRITEAIRVHDKLVLILSDQSIASDWVEGEVEAALERERREKKTVLFPIRLDDAVMESSIGWASHIRQTRHIGDFRGWKDHDSFEAAFARLLRDLKSEASTGAKDD
jgi:hypothetical protein